MTQSMGAKNLNFFAGLFSPAPCRLPQLEAYLEGISGEPLA